MKLKNLIENYFLRTRNVEMRRKPPATLNGHYVYTNLTMSHFIKRTVKTVYRGSCRIYVSYIELITETHVFSGEGGGTLI